MHRNSKPSAIYVTLLALTCFVSSVSNGQLTKREMDSLETELGKSKEDTVKVRILRDLANNAGYTNLNDALEYALQGFELSKKIKYEYGIGIMAYIAGFTYTDLNDYVKADSFLNIAEQSFLIRGDKSHLAKSANARGGMSFKQGDYWGAADHFLKSAEGFDELKDSTLSLLVYQNLISVLGMIKNYEKAIITGKKILKIAESRKDTLQVGYTLQSLCTNLIYVNRYEEAFRYLQPLLDIANSIGDHNLAAESFSTAGTYHYRKENYHQAVAYFEAAIERAITLDDQYQLANQYNALGDAFLKLNYLEKAKECFDKAAVLAKEYNNKRALYTVALSLGEYYSKAGDFKNGFENLKLHLDLKDSILDAETRNYSSYIETKYETNKKENEILRLQQVQQQKDFALKKRNIYLAIAGGLLVIAVIILSLVRKNFRNKQKLAKQQSALQEERINSMEKQQQVISLQSMINGQETERTRIARDLHDGLGGLFSTVKMHYSILHRESPSVKENPLYKKTLDLINNASDELRRVAHSMMPEVLMKVGLVEALQDLCNTISSGGLLHIRLQTFGMEKRLSGATEVMLYRIIQELVNNIIKHAYATEAIIQINREGNRLSLTIEDNGRGFDSSEAENRRTMGIATVKSRVDYLNGKLTIDSRKGIGTTVMVDLLLNEN